MTSEERQALLDAYEKLQPYIEHRDVCETGMMTGCTCGLRYTRELFTTALAPALKPACTCGPPLFPNQEHEPPCPLAGS